MNIFTSQFNPASGFSNTTLTIFPTSLDYFQTDYLAVMQEKDYLRLWSQSTWPEDHFTAEENKNDLVLHVNDNVTHRAYGYMIFTPDRKKCLGSVYFNSLEGLPNWYDVTPQLHQEIMANFRARIDYWCIKGMDEAITRALKEWIRSEWNIEVLFASREGMHERTETMKILGATQMARVKSLETSSYLELYSFR